MPALEGKMPVFFAAHRGGRHRRRRCASRSEFKLKPVIALGTEGYRMADD